MYSKTKTKHEDLIDMKEFGFFFTEKIKIKTDPKEGIKEKEKE